MHDASAGVVSHVVDHVFCYSTPPPVTMMKDDGASRSRPELERIDGRCRELAQ